MYKACVKCNKVLIDLNNGTYKCDNCNEDYDRFVWKQIMSFSIADHSKNVWVQAFGDVSQHILGNQITIHELGELFKTNQTAFEEAIRTIKLKSFIFLIHSKIENYNEENRIRTQVNQVSPLNYQEYGNYLISKITG